MLQKCVLGFPSVHLHKMFPRPARNAVESLLQHLLDVQHRPSARRESSDRQQKTQCSRPGICLRHMLNKSTMMNNKGPTIVSWGTTHASFIFANSALLSQTIAAVWGAYTERPHCPNDGAPATLRVKSACAVNKHRCYSILRISSGQKGGQLHQRIHG